MKGYIVPNKHSVGSSSNFSFPFPTICTDTYVSSKKKSNINDYYCCTRLIASVHWNRVGTSPKLISVKFLKLGIVLN